MMTYIHQRFWFVDKLWPVLVDGMVQATQDSEQSASQ